MLMGRKAEVLKLLAEIEESNEEFRKKYIENVETVEAEEKERFETRRRLQLEEFRTVLFSKTYDGSAYIENAKIFNEIYNLTQREGAQHYQEIKIALESAVQEITRHMDKSMAKFNANRQKLERNVQVLEDRTSQHTDFLNSKCKVRTANLRSTLNKLQANKRSLLMTFEGENVQLTKNLEQARRQYVEYSTRLKTLEKKNSVTKQRVCDMWLREVEGLWQLVVQTDCLIDQQLGIQVVHDAELEDDNEVKILQRILNAVNPKGPDWEDDQALKGVGIWSSNGLSSVIKGLATREDPPADLLEAVVEQADKNNDTKVEDESSGMWGIYTLPKREREKWEVLDLCLTKYLDTLSKRKSALTRVENLGHENEELRRILRQYQTAEVHGYLELPI
eukprot:Platyproteum_vivax@DN752_c0_g1_i1.p1